MRILGIDPGLNTTGYGVIEGEGLKVSLIEAGYIRTDPKQELNNRLEHIHNNVVKIIRRFNPRIMVLEKLYAHWRHPVTSCLLGHVRGVICLAAKENSLPVREYAATRIKKAVVGQGHATKAQVQSMVKNILSLKVLPEPADISDALALAIGQAYMRGSYRALFLGLKDSKHDR